MLYCSRADERSTGEQSRYIYQLEYESPHKIEKMAVGVDLSLDNNPPIEVKKGKREQEILSRYLDPSGEHSLSPTALFRYVECPLKFYMASIAKLRTNDELSDTIDALTFGNILHESMEELYKPLLKRANPNAEIKRLANRDTIAAAVDSTMCRLLMNSRKVSSEEFSGDMLLVRDIIIKYIQPGIMRYDIANEGYTIAGLEKDVDWQCPISNGRMVNLSGRADRIDRRADGALQIIDYKSRFNLTFTAVVIAIPEHIPDNGLGTRRRFHNARRRRLRRNRGRRHRSATGAALPEGTYLREKEITRISRLTFE